MTTTPVTPAGLRQYDHMVPIDAVMAAWFIAGDNPVWHHRMQRRVRKSMPLLARALDRLAHPLPLEGPHCKACGIRKHEHGSDCHANCPTCHGSTR
jgi:hypothetical protein